MPGSKIKRLKLTTLIDSSERGIAEVEEDEEALQLRRRRPTWSDLPPEILEHIASSKGLTPYDKIGASRVCKTWHSVMRVGNLFPWIFYYPGRVRGSINPDTYFDLYDPTNLKTYSLDIPEELRGATPCYAKDGWLLLHRRSTNGVFFFNPFTRESIKLPDFNRGTEKFAFSCAPTSPGCVVFIATLIAPGGDIRMHTCHPGATQWTTSIHRTYGFTFTPHDRHQIVVCNGLFYCLCFGGGDVGIFDPHGRHWAPLKATDLPTCKRRQRGKSECWRNATFAAEYKGEILAVHICCGENPRVFKLSQIMTVEWKEVSNLDGASFFATWVASLATNRMDLPPGGNRIYSPKTRFAGNQKRCISYSIDESRYHPSDSDKFNGNWKIPHLLTSLWIEPPQELPSFFSGGRIGGETMVGIRNNVSLNSS